METEVHVARQAIFDDRLNVFAYELLFRNELVDHYDGTDGDGATNRVIVNSFLLIGIKALTNGKRAFINFTANSLKSNIPRRLPRELIAVEILEDVIFDEKVIRACKELKRKGYLLVLDDFQMSERFKPILPLVDIIKIDFRATPVGQRKKLVADLKKYPIKTGRKRGEKREKENERARIE